MIYREHREDHDLSEGELDLANPVLDGSGVRLCRTVNESKNLNDVRGPAVIISSSGMMTGGRILHHLKQRLPSDRNTVVLGGFQADGTRGRLLQDGARWIRIHGHDVPVRAAIETVPGLSGHADRAALLRWLEPLKPPKARSSSTARCPAPSPSANRFSASEAGRCRFRHWEACMSSPSG